MTCSRRFLLACLKGCGGTLTEIGPRQERAGLACEGWHPTIALNLGVLVGWVTSGTGGTVKVRLGNVEGCACHGPQFPKGAECF